jgi:hypothetical protein
MSTPRHGCTFCVSLQRVAIRRRDVGLLDAADRLSAAHLAADVEREDFTRKTHSGAYGRRAPRKPQVCP